MAVFDHSEFDAHESLHFFNHAATGLRVIIAIHSTRLGPAAGGCRRWTYASSDDAITDALRLSRGMTYKNAVAGLRFGGGKAVILASETSPKSAELLQAYGRVVDSFDGRYITAEDVGMSVEDMRHVGTQTQFVSGLPQDGDSAGGDPSPWTAMGVFLGIKAAVKARLGSDSINGLRVAVQGVGHVGAHLCEYLADAGATLLVADVNAANAVAMQDRYGATIVDPDEILATDVDVLAPCALGNLLNLDTIDAVKATVIAGAANNQLSDATIGQALTERGILYAPDYVINAGGIISVAHEYYGDSTAAKVQADVEKIPLRLEKLFMNSDATGNSTQQLAEELAQSLVAAAGQTIG